MSNLGLSLEGRDPQEAESWYHRAVELGNHVAMSNLGVLLKERGDLAGAEHWLRRSADAGHDKAMYNLGLLLRERGDVAGAEHWYRRAAELGHPGAIGALSRLTAPDAAEQQSIAAIAGSSRCGVIHPNYCPSVVAVSL